MSGFELLAALFMLVVVLLIWAMNRRLMKLAEDVWRDAPAFLRNRHPMTWQGYELYALFLGSELPEVVSASTRKSWRRLHAMIVLLALLLSCALLSWLAAAVQSAFAG